MPLAAAGGIRPGVHAGLEWTRRIVRLLVGPFTGLILSQFTRLGSPVKEARERGCTVADSSDYVCLHRQPGVNAGPNTAFGGNAHEWP